MILQLQLYFDTNYDYDFMCHNLGDITPSNLWNESNTSALYADLSIAQMSESEWMNVYLMQQEIFLFMNNYNL